MFVGVRQRNFAVPRNINWLTIDEGNFLNDPFSGENMFYNYVYNMIMF